MVEISIMASVAVSVVVAVAVSVAVSILVVGIIDIQSYAFPTPVNGIASRQQAMRTLYLGGVPETFKDAFIWS